MATYLEHEEMLGAPEKCYCCAATSVIRIWAYCEGELELCSDHAKQLARKLLEDICACDTKEGRNG